MVIERSKPIVPLVDPLTRREREVLKLLEGNLTGREIADQLTIAASTTKWYIQQIYGKLGVHNRRQAIERAYELRLLEGSNTYPPRSDSMHNLPRQLTTFIGREKEITQVKGLLEKHALVTLTGSGGVGKTRLALQVAQEVLERYPDGMWLVDLAPLSDTDKLAQRVAVALGLWEESNRHIQAALVDFMRGKAALIVLDNCEHLLPACAQLAASLLSACTQIDLLATSREVLGVPGEMAYRVSPMHFPDFHPMPEQEQFQQYEAVRLFVDRANLALPCFQVTATNAPAVVQICQRLEGIPLALELAAARMSILTAEQIAQRLEDIFGLLTGGSRTALPRQQTLRAAIDWSYNLLSKKERILMHRLSVFAGGSTLEAIEEVCAGQGIERDEILDALSSLVKKSIVIAERGQDVETRYRMLETVRQYAREKLLEWGENQLLSNRHCRYFRQFAEIGELKLRSGERLEWMRRLNADLDNLRAAIQWAYAGQRDIETGLRIAVAIGIGFIQTIGLFEEARQWLLTGLSAWDPSADRLLKAKALNVLGSLDISNSISTDTLQWCEESVRLCRSIGPAANAELSWALRYLGLTLIILHEDWELETARSLVEESVVVARQLKGADRWYLTMSIGSLVDLYLRRGNKDYPQIRRLAEENLQLRLQTGDRWSGGQAMWSLAELAELQGSFEQALSYLQKALALYQEANDKWGVALTYRNFGRLYRHQGEYQTAILYDQEHLRLWAAMRIRSRVSDSLRRLGVDQALIGKNLPPVEKVSKFWQAAKMLGAAEEIIRNDRSFTTPADMEDYKKVLDLLHGYLDPAEFVKAWAEGQAMTLDEAVKYALSISPAD